MSQHIEVLRFVYRDADGNVARHELAAWQEVGKYVRGRRAADGSPRTFLKERIVEYLENAEAWLNSPYPDPIPKLQRQVARDQRPQVAFTGFPSARRAELEAHADRDGLRVCKGVTRDLQFLVGGPNAGPSKVEQARNQGCWILTEEQLLKLLETGELPA